MLVHINVQLIFRNRSLILYKHIVMLGNFFQNSETVIELKLKLRPLWPELSQCSMQILISSVLIADEEAK